MVETKHPNHGNFSNSTGFQDHVDERSEACIVSSALGIPSLHAGKGVCVFIDKVALSHGANTKTARPSLSSTV